MSEQNKQEQIDYLKKAEQDQPQVELDLFGEPMTPPAKAKTADKPKPNPQKPKDENKTYGTEYVILVFDQRIAVPEENMTLEKIRGFIEMDYPQFAKDRTEMFVDEPQKYIIPNVAKAPKKG